MAAVRLDMFTRLLGHFRAGTGRKIPEALLQRQYPLL